MNNRRRKGFTLIELLVVIAILGVMAVVMLVVINPVERLAQSRDAGRISSVTQMGHAIAAFYTDSATYPTTANWAQELVDSGNFKAFPPGVAYTAYVDTVSPCAVYVQPAVDPTYCYNLDVTNGPIVFARAEANRHNQECPAADEGAYFVYSMADSRGGTICSVGDPLPWAAGTQAYTN